MTNPNNPVTSSTSTSSTQASEQAPPTAPTGTPGGEFSTSGETPNSLEDLKTKSPELYNAMMIGIATNICNEMKDHQTKLKEMKKQAEREAEGK